MPCSITYVPLEPRLGRSFYMYIYIYIYIFEHKAVIFRRSKKTPTGIFSLKTSASSKAHFFILKD